MILSEDRESPGDAVADVNGGGSKPSSSPTLPGYLSVSAHSEGLQLDGSLLWFDAPECHDICLLSRYPQVRPPKFGTRVMASSGVCGLLEASLKDPRNRAAAIVSDYFRPFSIGSYGVEFLPAGCELGASSIFITLQKGSQHLETLCYASCPTPVTSSSVQETQLKKSQVLVLVSVSPNLHYKMPDKNQELERLAESCKNFHKNKGFYPTLMGPALGPLQEVMHFFAVQGLEVSLPARLHRLAKIYKDSHLALGEWSRWRGNSEQAEEKIPMAILPIRRSREYHFPPGVFLVASHLHQYLDYKKRFSFDDHFLVSGESSLQDLKQTLGMVAPQRLIITGPYIKHYSDVLKDHKDMKIIPVYPNNQPTLF